ncbi:MAG: hypothetical protein WBS24_14620 [Terriglobales bacterium]
MNTVNEQAKKIGADDIREYSAKTFVQPARQRGQERFSIRVGDVVRELRLYRSIPAVCSALKTQEFQRSNGLRLVDATGPKSGLSTTVVFTYEFVDSEPPADPAVDAWSRLRGALKDVFAELGGGEAYLQAERRKFYAAEEPK